jgi:hypothetical protein
VRALAAAGDDDRAGLLETGRGGDDDLLDGRRGAQRLERPRVERAPVNGDERLRPTRPKALATTGSDEKRGGAQLAAATF